MFNLLQPNFAVAVDGIGAGIDCSGGTVGPAGDDWVDSASALSMGLLPLSSVVGWGGGAGHSCVVNTLWSESNKRRSGNDDAINLSDESNRN